MKVKGYAAAQNARVLRLRYVSQVNPGSKHADVTTAGVGNRIRLSLYNNPEGAPPRFCLVSTATPENATQQTEPLARNERSRGSPLNCVWETRVSHRIALTDLTTLLGISPY